MIESVDQLGQAHRFDESRQRIVSLVPSITELLVDLGLRQNIVGCTKFCVHPNDLKADTAIVGGTKNVRRLAVEALSPDLIIASKEENVKEQVEALQKSCPVWVSDVVDLASGAEMNVLLGELFGLPAIANEINAANARSLAKHSESNRGTALYLIWKDPYMSVGGDTYINNVMEAVGYENVCRNEQRYPILEVEKIKALNPAHMLLSSEPFPFKEKHIAELQAICPDADVRLVDGEFYSWYGSRMGKL